MSNPVHASRFGLLAALLLVTHPLHVSGQSIVASVQPDFVLLRTAEHQVKPLAPLVRFGSDARHGNGRPRMLAVAQLSEALTEQARRMARPSDVGWVGQSASRDWARQNRSANSGGSTSLRGQQPGQRQRSWIGRRCVGGCNREIACPRRSPRGELEVLGFARMCGPAFERRKRLQERRMLSCSGLFWFRFAHWGMTEANGHDQFRTKTTDGVGRHPRVFPDLDSTSQPRSNRSRRGGQAGGLRQFWLGRGLPGDRR